MDEKQIRKIIIEELIASEFQDNYTYEDIANSIIWRIYENPAE